jgi:hypothetical protein
MTQAIIDKVAILLVWPRELNQLKPLITSLNDDLVFIIDNFRYTEPERKGRVDNLVKLLGNQQYVYLSEVIGVNKYRVLISTAQTYQEYVTFHSYIRYIYAITVGRFFDVIGMSDYLLASIGRPFNGGGIKSKIFEMRQIERMIGLTTICYPKGLDVNIKAYPPERLRGVFDIYLCHSSIDRDLINSKFSDTKCVVIGNPKYDNPPSVFRSKHIISNDFHDINTSKPILLWIPTHINIQGESLLNILIWLPAITQLSAKYNIVIRPHPKSLAIDSKIMKKLNQAGLIVDSRSDRDLCVLYQASDLVLADYGSSVLSAIYMKKKLLLLNMPNKTKFLRLRKNKRQIDQEVRNDAKSFEYNDMSLYKNIKDSIEQDKDLELTRLKQKYFGNDNNLKKISEVADNFIGELLGTVQIE